MSELAVRGESRLNANVALFRQELLGAEPALTLRNLFADLKRVSRCASLCENIDRSSQCVRLDIERSRGQGAWELFRLDPEAYVVVADGYYHADTAGVVPGEGLFEFHLRMSGVLELRLPGQTRPLQVTGPRLLLMYQPPGADIYERVLSERRDTCVSVYCALPYLRRLLQRNSIAPPAFLDELHRRTTPPVWWRELDLGPGMHLIGRSLVHNRYRGGVRLLHAEAKVLELLCEVLSAEGDASAPAPAISEAEARQLDAARLMLARQFTPPPRIQEIAARIGMSSSKLKRSFKARFGRTVFDYGLECRMREALELLRCHHLSVGQVAHRVGYSHQTSFTAAFRDYFGFLPKDARNALP